MASRIAEKRDESEFEERRAFPRVPVALPASLQIGNRRHSVHLLDVSAGGAKLKCTVDLLSGDRVNLDCGLLDRQAVVRWQDDGFVGVAFEDELDAKEVTALIARSCALDSRIKSRG